MSVLVIRPGAQSLIVDRGRFGVRHLGIAWCGASDRAAYDAANELCGNDPDAAAIEITLGNAEFEFTKGARFALTGADLEATLDGEMIAPYRAHGARDGSRLKLSFPKRGARSILALAGGIDVPLVLGSRTTDLAAAFGGYRGRALRSGDAIDLGFATDAEGIDALGIPKRETVFTVLCFDRFSQLHAQSQVEFFESPWSVTHESNRMGYRLSGATLRFEGPPVQPHAVFPGFIQLPPSGQPIVLLADAHVTGGYPSVGMVHAPALDAISQLRPGETLRFRRMEG